MEGKPCLEARKRLLEKEAQERLREERKKMIQFNICPDCGYELITQEEDKRGSRALTSVYHFEKICPKHGIIHRFSTTGGGFL